MVHPPATDQQEIPCRNALLLFSKKVQTLTLNRFGLLFLTVGISTLRWYRRMSLPLFNGDASTVKGGLHGEHPTILRRTEA